MSSTDTVTVTVASSDGATHSLTANVVYLGPKPTSKTLFGARCGPSSPTDTETQAQMQTRVIAALSGGQLGVERIFNEGGTTWNTPKTTAKHLILSVAADAKQTAAGQLNSQWSTLMSSITVPTSISLVQECDLANKSNSDGSLVTPQLYRAAMSVVKNLSAAHPLIRTIGIYTSYELNAQGSGYVAQYVDPSMDEVGIDCYANRNLGNVDSLLKTYQLAVAFAKSVGKPLAIPETSFGLGVGKGGQGYTAAEVTAMVTAGLPYLQANGVLYCSWFEANKTDGYWALEFTWPDATAIYKAAVIASVNG